MDQENVVRPVVAILLLIVFFTQCFAQSFILVKFYVNQSYYQSICENKTRPMLHCNGKCQLAKKIKQAEKKDQQNSSRRVDTGNNDVVCFPASTYNFYCASLLKNHFDHFRDNHTVEFPVSIFHPPSFKSSYA